ncbi:MAG: hypothetical protein CMF59_06860 [Leptospiraceae bacterium]|nr:hypothetical protein [Leptospiraceae bacterium]
MKRRVFYVVNLDRGRILALVLFVAGTLVLSFSTGYRFANTSEAASVNPSDSPEPEFREPQSFDDPRESTEDLSLNAVSESEDRADPAEKKSDNDRDSETRSDLALKSTEEPGSSRNQPSDKKSVTFSDIARKTDKPTQPEPKKEKPAPKPKPTPAKKPAPQKKEVVKKEAPRSEEKKPQKIYTLQMGAFSSRGAANRMAEQIRKEGMQPYVVTSGNLHLVRLGRSKTKSGLNAEEKKLRAAKFRPITVTVGQ